MEKLIISRADGPGVVILVPYGKHHPLTGIVKDAEGIPVARKMSIWYENESLGLTPALNTDLLGQLDNIFYSEADGTFKVELNEHLGTAIIIAYGEAGENNQIVAKIDLETS